MDQPQLNWIANFIWGIADDVLRDLYVRGKYRDVILPMTVLRRLDSLLEPTKEAVLDMKISLDKAGVVHQDQALRKEAGQAFYNTWRLRFAISGRGRISNSSRPTSRLPRRLLAECAGHPREVRISEPDPASVEGRRAWHAEPNRLTTSSL